MFFQDFDQLLLETMEYFIKTPLVDVLLHYPLLNILVQNRKTSISTTLNISIVRKRVN